MKIHLLLLFVYAALLFVIRIFVSPTMDLDNAEQFAIAQDLALGYPREAPLYSWICYLLSHTLPDGYNSGAFPLLLLRHSLIFSFFSLFYLTVRGLWRERSAFIVASSLWLNFVYAYEFSRTLTHTTLASVMTLLVVFIYGRLLKKPSSLLFFGFGLAAGLAFLSKYNALFAILALGITAPLCKDSRELIFDRRLILSIIAFFLVSLPHLQWLFENNYVTILETVGRTNIQRGGNFDFLQSLRFWIEGYVDVLIFLGVFSLFFFRSIRVPEAAVEHNNHRLYLALAVSAVVIPGGTLIALGSGEFSAKWLAPVFFLLPMGIFQFVNLEENKKRSTIFRNICLTIPMLILISKAVIGFLPDLTGKKERIHIDFSSAPAQITKLLRPEQQKEYENRVVLSQGYFLASNTCAQMKNCLPADFARKDRLPRKAIFLWPLKAAANAKTLSIPKDVAALYPSVEVAGKIELPYFHSSSSERFFAGMALLSDKREGATPNWWGILF